MNKSARQVARETLKASVPSDLWEQNERFHKELLEVIGKHSLLRHPAITAMTQASFDVAILKKIHLEFRYTWAETFTDALLRAMFLMRELEPRFGAISKMSARFLLQFNVLDELGISPGDGTSEYGGSPKNAHYIKFVDTLKQLGVSEAEARAYVPSDEAVACRRMLEGSYDDAVCLLMLLGVAESVFTHFAGPWAKNVKTKTTVDTETGYHSIHVDHDGENIDDDHADDLWYVFRHVVEPARYGEVREKIVLFLDCLVKLMNTVATV